MRNKQYKPLLLSTERKRLINRIRIFRVKLRVLRRVWKMIYLGETYQGGAKPHYTARLCDPATGNEIVHSHREKRVATVRPTDIKVDVKLKKICEITYCDKL